MGSGNTVAIIALVITAIGQIVTLAIWGTRLTVAVATLQKALTDAVDDLTDAVRTGEARHELLRVTVTEHEVRLGRHDEQIKNHDLRLKAGGH